MPTVLRSGPYRFYFYANDRGERPHVHVERDDNRAKFWLSPVSLFASNGFGRPEINKLATAVAVHETEFLRAWHEFFGP